MRTLSPDTSPGAEAVQVALLRQAGDARRASLCRSLTGTVVSLSRSALRDRMPGAAEVDVLLRWVAMNYGEALAAGVARRLGRIA